MKATPTTNRPLLSLAHAAMNRMTEKDLAVFTEILQETAKGCNDPYTFSELAYHIAGHAVGASVSADDTTGDFANVRALKDIILRGGWFGEFMEDLLDRHRAGDVIATPDDMMRILSFELDKYLAAVGAAKETLKKYPEAVAANVREFAQKHPDLMANPVPAGAHQ